MLCLQARLDRDGREPAQSHWHIRNLEAMILKPQRNQHNVFILRHFSSPSPTGEVFVAGFGDEFPDVGPQR